MERMKEFEDLIGQKFNRWTVIEKDFKNNCRDTLWKCQCDCGNFGSVTSSGLKNNKSKSCGCLRKEVTIKRNIKHGLGGTTEYKTWNSMVNRCLNENTPNYKYYGEKGIKVCERWLEENGKGFVNFLEDMGLKPGKEYSIDRIDNNLGYSKENCKWSTKKEQANNRKTSRKVINTETKIIYDTIADAARAIGLSPCTISNRIARNNSMGINLEFHDEIDNDLIWGH